jgi:nucleolar protein 56
MFDVNRQDKPVVQSIALIDQLDKNINSFCMRIKEWFGWHFPELNRIVADNTLYVKIVNLIQQRKNLIENFEDLKDALIEIVVDDEIAKQVYDAACASMGSDLNDMDLV